MGIPVQFIVHPVRPFIVPDTIERKTFAHFTDCLLYTSDAADDLLCVDLGGRRIIKKKNKKMSKKQIYKN